ncbi:hypothetical protein RDWZM_002348 [Blomia tropicalis]|uniref:Uncharacterized protein n=1 Tax=Blomia tropicalis TaxID=40697 RepID=A0A9Q0MCL5_BLOTA|nr:hypothetical protein RDWZM_002348 [Blomia tropicalis]
MNDFKKNKGEEGDGHVYDEWNRFKRKSQFDQTTIFGKIWFTYVYPLFWRGYRKKGIDMEDIDQCPKDEKAEILIQQLTRIWEIESKKKNPKFWKALLRSMIKQTIFPLIIFMFIECFLNIAQSLFLGQVILYFSNNERNDYQTTCFYAAGICLTTILNISLSHPAYVYMAQLGMRARIVCCTLLYRKSLRLSRSSMNQTAVGQIVNMMSNDTFAYFSSFLITGPIQTIIIIYIIWSYLGASCISGLIIMFIFVPFQSIMGKLFSYIRFKTAMLTDTRLRYMMEIITGIRVIKMYNWEDPFAKRVADSRKKEVNKIRQSCFLKAFNLALFVIVSRLILFICLIVYVLLGNVLTSEIVFVTMALLNTLRLNMTLFFPQSIAFAAEIKISCQRIQDFLMLEEVDTENVHKKQKISNGFDKVQVHNENVQKIQIRAENINANWIAEQKQPTLKNISIDLKAGDLLIVIGPVGSGKSSFLMTLLKELPIDSGTITIDGKLSYASQDPWSFNASVRSNILFGMPFDQKKYDHVIDVCALKHDLQQLPFNDRTLVGERGVSLSGGQKARINLARAVYRNADILLLDDPLSAVDTSVAEHIFNECILNYLKNKICILVTHQIQLIEKATKILILKDGKCLAYGTYNEIHDMGIDFVQLLAKPTEQPIERPHSMMSSIDSLTTSHGDSSNPLLDSLDGKLFDNKKSDDKKIQIEDEQYQRGSIKKETYLEYFRSGSNVFMLFATILSAVISQALFHGVDVFLKIWTNKNQQEIDSIDDSEQQWDIFTYSILIILSFIFSILRSVSFFLVCMRASVKLHNKIFARLLRTSITFFDSNPAGRILNRFTKDLGVIDELLPFVGYDINLIILQAIGTIAVVAYVTWYLFIPALFLTFMVILARGFYIYSARDIKRYEGLTRSPVYSHLSTTLNGLTSIRAYGEQRTFEKQFFIYQNNHTATWFLFICSTRAIGLIVDWICILFSVIVITTIMLGHDMTGGDAGLAISSVLLLSGSMQWGIRQTVEFENQMISVERVVEYQHLNEEAPSEVIQMKPDENWPNHGKIVFDRMSLAYSDENVVLNDITCTIEGGEKIGIVGRTGAGKSSLITSLFRLIEPKGTICIDGIDIQTIGLNDLRRKISIIPQDPVIFSGTVRYNLDPFNEYEDSNLWLALEKVQLKSQVENFPGMLDANLSHSGGNLSVGQRQLICLARAILKQNQILVLDEATANVDYQTDSLIQKTIRTEFASCTVLTIAHRLNTIIDCDRILVLYNGKIVEFDTPYQLLKRKSYFYRMVKKAGPTIFEHLYQIARNHCHKSNSSSEYIKL